MLLGANINKLNEEFAIDGHITFESGPGDLPIARIGNTHAAALVSIYAAHVMSFQPHGQEPVLWQSESSYFNAGKPIRGGIPICWPWFGAHPQDPAKPAHGFARLSLWKLVATSALEDGSTRIELLLTDNDKSNSLWPNNKFNLTARITVGESLELALTTKNTGFEKFSITDALHSYFAVDNVKNISISGFEGCPYVDTLLPDGLNKFTQKGPIKINSETDRVYLQMEKTAVIEDPDKKRKILVGKSGSKTSVVWNPWVDKSQRMRDFGNDEFHKMLCVEVTNTMDDGFTLAPGEEHSVSTVISVEPL
jgi:glucose-6-phosphate 1-epimerase